MMAAAGSLVTSQISSFWSIVPFNSPTFGQPTQLFPPCYFFEQVGIGHRIKSLLKVHRRLNGGLAFLVAVAGLFWLGSGDGAFGKENQGFEVFGN